MNDFKSTKHALKWVQWVITIGCLTGMVLSPTLWVGNRLFPLIPMIDGLARLPNWFSTSLFYGFVLNLMLDLIKPNPWSAISTIWILLFLIVQDQNRLQPWIFMYLLFLIILYLVRFHQNLNVNALFVLKIILICLYFWSGIHKINPVFIQDVFYGILSRLFHIQNPIWMDRMLPLGYLIPMTEIMIAIGFILPNWQKVAALFAITTHIFIIFYLLIINHNWVVIPWNVTMIFIHIILFFIAPKQDEPISNGGKIVASLHLGLLGFMPLFNFVGYWDDYLSFSLYSQKNKIYYVAISDDYVHRLNGQFDAYFVNMGNEVSGGHLIDVNKWALQTLKVPVYPEYRVFRQISKHFCNYNIPNTDLLFLVYEQPISTQNLTKWTCNTPN